MTQPRPRRLDGARARRLLAKARGTFSVAGRVEILSGLLLGAPYEANGLAGSATTPERFTAPLDRFDCVTYVETVLALARAASAGGFAEELRLIRYDGGRVDWTSRNHYMTGWVRANTRGGAVRTVPSGDLAVRRERLLDAVPGLPPRRTRFACVPKGRAKALAPRLRTGDLIFFASTRAHLDVFHCGLLVGGAGGWRMRHASRSRGGVVEQDLAEFLKANRMAGVIVARPVDGSGTARA